MRLKTSSVFNLGAKVHELFREGAAANHERKAA
jgi:hypothetical protein